MTESTAVKNALPGNVDGRHIGEVQYLKRDLATRSVRGGASTVASEICCNIVRIGGTAVLARLLMPEHFGLVAMVTALTAAVERFRDLGLGLATIQSSEITHEQVSTLFWINTAVGTLIMLLISAGAPLISLCYGDSRLTAISIAISSSFFFAGLTIQHQALLRRHMHFTRGAAIQFVSTTSSFALGIVLAWSQFGYWALVWKEVARSVVDAIGAWLAYRWLPGRPQRRSGIEMFIRTGKYLTGVNIVIFLSRNVDQILLGKFWGPTPLGIYRQAAQLLLLPGSLFTFPVTHVMTPALSAMQGDPERYRRYYRKALALLSFGFMPVTAYVAVYADAIIAVVLGEQWIAAAPILRILALVSFVEPIGGTAGIVMITCGRMREYFRWGLISAVSFTIAVCIGVNWGLLGVATAIVISVYVVIVPLLFLSLKNTLISSSLCLEAIFLPAVSSLLMSLMLIPIRHAFVAASALVEIGLSLVIAPLLYCGAWMLLPGGKHTLIERLSSLRLVLEALPFSLRVRGLRVQS